MPRIEMKSHQKTIRESKHGIETDGLFGNSLWEHSDRSIDKAEIREVSFDAAKVIIHDYEWLGNMGTTEYAFGIFWNNIMAGAVCFGRTAGTSVYSSVCGEQYKLHAITLCRGACVHWAHEHSASKLIATACRMMLGHGYNIFIAYSDPQAGEVGTVYQASNWIYCGMTSATEKFKTPNGKVKDARLVSAYTRDRRGGTLKYKRTRSEQKRRMIEQGCVFFKGTPKHRYVLILGETKKIKREIMKALKWPVQPYPKRAAEVSEATRQASSLQGEVQSLDAAPSDISHLGTVASDAAKP